MINIPPITRPTLLVDEERCRLNIVQMAKKITASGSTFRPHFKTHQSIEVGRWFRDAGIVKITVSSVSMAEYFAEEWNDITIAFPVNILEAERINDLAGRIDLNILVESDNIIPSLNGKIKSELGFFIKIDTGYHRTGIDADDRKKIDAVLDEAGKYENFIFKGFLSHSGHTYHAKDRADVTRIYNDAAGKLKVLREWYSGKYPGIIASLGDTPSASVVEDFRGIDELRPGNFIFYDLMQMQAGNCLPDQIAVKMACPVVAVHPERSELVIYGGAVHLSKDLLFNERYGTYYGVVLDQKDGTITNIIDGMFLSSLSQEHGIVKVPPEIVHLFSPGDILTIIPVHSCLTADLASYYLSTNGSRIEKFID